jgi:hypothetical protein
MTDYSATNEQYFNTLNNVFSQDYMLVTGDSTHIGFPVALYLNGITHESFQNKIWIENYVDTASLTGCMGVAWRNVPVSGDTNASFLGINPNRRDLSVLIQGEATMEFISGLVHTETRQGMLVAPYASGFVDWRTGMAILGKCLRSGAHTGMRTQIFVNPQESETAHV